MRIYALPVILLASACGTSPVEPERPVALKVVLEGREDFGCSARIDVTHQDSAAWYSPRTLIVEPKARAATIYQVMPGPHLIDVSFLDLSLAVDRLHIIAPDSALYVCGVSSAVAWE